jgi:hypothetical protein
MVLHHRPRLHDMSASAAPDIGAGARNFEII